jgi:hypothetical protein
VSKYNDAAMHCQLLYCRLKASDVPASWLGFSRARQCKACTDPTSLRMGWKWADGTEDTYPMLDKWRESEPEPQDSHAILYNGEWVGVDPGKDSYAFICEQGRLYRKICFICEQGIPENMLSDVDKVYRKICIHNISSEQDIAENVFMCEKGKPENMLT